MNWEIGHQALFVISNVMLQSCLLLFSLSCWACGKQYGTSSQHHVRCAVQLGSDRSRMSGRRDSWGLNGSVQSSMPGAVLCLFISKAY